MDSSGTGRDVAEGGVGPKACVVGNWSVDCFPNWGENNFSPAKGSGWKENKGIKSSKKTEPNLTSFALGAKNPDSVGNSILLKSYKRSNWVDGR